MLKLQHYLKALSRGRYHYILLFLSAFFLCLLSEYICRGSLVKVFIWIFSNPISFFINLLVVTAIILLLTAVFNSYRVGFSLASILIMLFSVVNRMKLGFRGIPLIPKDLYLNNEILTIANVVLTSDTIKLAILFLISISFIILLIMNIPKFKLEIKERLLLVLISIALIFTFINTNISKNISLDDEDINVEKNGFIFFFVSNIKATKRSLSFEYIANNIKEPNEDKTNYSNNRIKPNIVVIMNEAFWSPSKMKGIQFSKSPTLNINKLKENSIYGDLESPTFGGGTANTEYELLTGNSAHFFNPGYMVYPNEIKGPIMALPSILRNQGYTTKAIHPFKNWYWNRQKVYNYMGFNEFISEEYLINPVYKGFFISDEYVSDMIIKEMKKNEKPIFIFAVTMQNHGPYNDNRYKDYPKDVKVSGKISSEALQILETYTQGVYDADKALGKLINYCSKNVKPTIVLFFGDHLPVLGKDYKVYKESGYFSKNNREIALTSVPFILWSNYSNKSKNLGLLNTSFMGPYLLEYAGLEMPNYFKFLKSFSDKIPVISRSYAIDHKGDIISSNTNKYKTHNDDYLLAQQNIMYEDKAFEVDYNSWIVDRNPNYNSSLKKISIDKVIIKQARAIIKGINFYPKCSVIINNKSIGFKYINDKEIHIEKKYIKSGSKLEIILLDSKDDLLAESNSYIFK